MCAQILLVCSGSVSYHTLNKTHRRWVSRVERMDGLRQAARCLELAMAREGVFRLLDDLLELVKR